MITFPAPYMPFPPTPPNPALDGSRARVWRWIDNVGLAEDDDVRRLLHRADPELTTARYFPTAAPDLFVYLAQLMGWIFVNDDLFDDGGLGRDATRCRAAVAARLDVLDGVFSSEMMEHTLADLWSRLPAGRSAGWYATFRGELRAFLHTYDVEYELRQSAEPPTIEDYLAHRRDSAGTRWCADLVEVEVGVDLPASVRRHPAYQTVKDAAAGHCGLINDLFSVGKELATGQIHNAVYLVMHHKGCGIDEALQRVDDMATDCVHTFEGAARALPASIEVDAWVAGVRDLVRGNFDWHLESERYRGDRAQLITNTIGGTT